MKQYSIVKACCLTNDEYEKEKIHEGYLEETLKCLHAYQKQMFDIDVKNKDCKVRCRYLKQLNQAVDDRYRKKDCTVNECHEQGQSWMSGTKIGEWRQNLQRNVRNKDQPRFQEWGHRQ